MELLLGASEEAPASGRTLRSLPYRVPRTLTHGQAPSRDNAAQILNCTLSVPNCEVLNIGNIGETGWRTSVGFCFALPGKLFDKRSAIPCSRQEVGPSNIALTSEAPDNFRGFWFCMTFASKLCPGGDLICREIDRGHEPNPANSRQRTNTSAGVAKSAEIARMWSTPGKS